MNHLPQLLGLSWGLSEAGLSIVKRARSDATLKDRHSLRLIWLVNLIAVALAIIAARKLSSVHFPSSPVITAACFILFICGITLRWYSIFYLGRFFTVNVAIHSDHRVVDSGPYRYIRHPSYTGGFLTVLGFAFTFHNWASFLILVVPCFSVTLWRIHIEEAALLEALKPQYANYAQRTKRLIPFIY
ncbi:MAG: methyltransferase family protein [Limisphaerales bacterium]